MLLHLTDDAICFVLATSMAEKEETLDVDAMITKLLKARDRKWVAVSGVNFFKIF